MLHENLMDEILSNENLMAAYKKVCANKGAAGVDGMTTKQLGKHLNTHWETMKAKIADGNYKPAAVKGVQIHKKDGGIRQLGIPTCQDRFIQQAIAQKLNEKIDHKMHKCSYGYRPGRSAHDAITRAGYFVKQGKTWVIELDIKAFFDHVNHDILMARIAKETRDKTVLKLIGRYLRAPMVQGNHRIKRDKGTPQGGPLSPILANIYLDALDKEMDKRKLNFCRYADDINIYVGSERSGQRVLSSLSKWIEEHLRLKVHPEKSQVIRPWNGNFLGFSIQESGQPDISKPSVKRYKDRVRELWHANQGKTSKALVKQWREYILGWWNYFCIADWNGRSVSGWTRRHMRKCFWQRWKSKKGRMRNLTKLGISSRFLKRIKYYGSAWRNAKHFVLQTALNSKVLIKYGLITPADLATQ